MITDSLDDDALRPDLDNLIIPAMDGFLTAIEAHEPFTLDELCVLSMSIFTNLISSAYKNNGKDYATYLVDNAIGLCSEVIRPIAQGKLILANFNKDLLEERFVDESKPAQCGNNISEPTHT